MNFGRSGPNWKVCWQSQTAAFSLLAPSPSLPLLYLFSYYSSLLFFSLRGCGMVGWKRNLIRGMVQYEVLHTTCRINLLRPFLFKIIILLYVAYTHPKPHKQVSQFHPYTTFKTAVQQDIETSACQHASKKFYSGSRIIVELAWFNCKIKIITVNWNMTFGNWLVQKRKNEF